jgi:hypothetical protein
VRNITIEKGETSVSKSSITRSITFSFVLITSFALVTADLLMVSAQNANSSTTQSDEQTRGGMMTTQNSNSSGGTQRRRPRRRHSTRRAAATSGGSMNMNGDMAGNANTADDTQNANTAGDASSNANMSGDMSGGMSSGGRRRRGRRRAASTAADTSGGMQTTATTDAADGGMQEDLSGKSFTGTANYSDGGVTGPATLSFESGNQFTLTPEGGTAMSGRYTAVTTRGYTGVTMMFNGATPPAIVSVRLKKMGRGVSVMSVPGESRQFSFTSSGGGGMAMSGGGHRRPRRKRGKRGGIKPPMADPTSTTTP